LEFTRTQRWVIGGAILVALLATIVMLVSRGRSDEVTIVDAGVEVGQAQAGSQSSLLTVHVVGGVKYPGVYRVRNGARVCDAVVAAGGLTSLADSQAVNLAAFLTDGQQVYIPARNSQLASASTPVASSYPQLQTQRSAPPAPRQTAPQRRPASGVAARTRQVPSSAKPGVSPPTGQSVAPSLPSRRAASPTGSASPPAAASGSQVAGTRSAPPSSSRRSRSAPTASFPINVNCATETQLQALPGVGASLASRIVLYRMQHGPFRRLEDLTNVKGIGSKTASKLAPYITL